MLVYKEITITVLKSGYSVQDFETGDEVFFSTLSDAKRFIDTMCWID